MAWWNLFNLKDEDQALRIFRYAALIGFLAMGAFVLIFMDWDRTQIGVSLRVMFVKAFNVALVWGPGFLLDLASPGEDIEKIKANPLALAGFYGLMGMATAIVVAFGAV